MAAECFDLFQCRRDVGNTDVWHPQRPYVLREQLHYSGARLPVGVQHEIGPVEILTWPGLVRREPGIELHRAVRLAAPELGPEPAVDHRLLPPPLPHPPPPHAEGGRARAART